MEKGLNHHPALTYKRSLGERAADKLTSAMGSWIFLGIFILFLLAWITLNAYFLISYRIGQPWDPYPFIFLNLVLACLTAFEAPIILMSQNRAEKKDRIRSEYDYVVDRKAEKEIREIKEQLARIERKLK